MIDPNTIRDGREPEATPKWITVPIEKSLELQRALETFKRIHDAILQDDSLADTHMRTISENLSSLRFVFGNRSFSAEELWAQREGIRQSMLIWKELKNDQWEHTIDLVFLNDETAKLIASRYPRKGLYLPDLRYMTDSQTTLLVNGVKDQLYFDGLTSLTDNQAASFATFRGQILSLNGIVNPSENQISALCRCHDSLRIFMKGLETLTDTQASCFAKFKGAAIFFTEKSLDISETGLQSLYAIKNKIGRNPVLVARIEAAGPPPSES